MKGNTNTTVTIGVILALLLVALLSLTVLEEVEYQRQENFSNLPDYTYVFFTVAPISVIAIVGGFWFMRKGPVLCLMMIISGSAALAIMTYWLVVPLLLAVGLCVYAFRRAGRNVI